MSPNLVAKFSSQQETYLADHISQLTLDFSKQCPHAVPSIGQTGKIVKNARRYPVFNLMFSVVYKESSSCFAFPSFVMMEDHYLQFPQELDLLICSHKHITSEQLKMTIPLKLANYWIYRRFWHIIHHRNMPLRLPSPFPHLRQTLSSITYLQQRKKLVNKTLN